MSHSPSGGGDSVDYTPTSDAQLPLLGRFGGKHVLVPLLTNEVPNATDQLEIATTLTRVTGASMSVVNPIPVPEQTPKQLVHDIPDDGDRALLEWVLDEAAASDIDADGGFFYTRDIVRGLLKVVRTQDIDTMVLPSKSDAGWFRKGLVEQIAAYVDCDVVVVNGQAGYEGVPSILLPVAGGPNAGLSADIARAIAADCDAWIDVLHVVDEGVSVRERNRARATIESTYHRIARPESTTTWMLEADDVAEAIIDQSRYYGLTVIGAPTKGRLKRFIYGSTNKSIRSDAQCVVLSTKNNQHTSPSA